MESNPIVSVILGAGGHAAVIAELLQTAPVSGRVCIHAFVEKVAPAPSTHFLGLPVLGPDEILLKLADKGVTHFTVAIGSVRPTRIRACAFALACRAGLRPLTVVHPSAVVSPSAVIADGVHILAGAVIGTGAVLGENVIVNSGAIVEHHCRVGSHTHIASGACLAGQVEVGECSIIGNGSAVRQGIRIGSGAGVGTGAVVVIDVPDGVVVVGNPARPLPPSA